MIWYRRSCRIAIEEPPKYLCAEPLKAQLHHVCVPGSFNTKLVLPRSSLSGMTFFLVGTTVYSTTREGTTFGPVGKAMKIITIIYNSAVLETPAKAVICDVSYTGSQRKLQIIFGRTD